MTARPPSESNPWGLAVWERIGIGALGLAAGVFLLWLTWAVTVVIGIATDPACNGVAPLWVVGFALLVAGAVGLCWLIVASVLSFAVRLRGIRGSAWLAVPAAFMALTGISYGLDVAHQPAGTPPPGACAPIYE